MRYAADWRRFAPVALPGHSGSPAPRPQGGRRFGVQCRDQNSDFGGKVAPHPLNWRVRLLSAAPSDPLWTRWYGARVTAFRNGAAALVLLAAIAFAGCGESKTKTVTQTTSAPAGAPPARSCGTTAGNFITRLQATGVDCTTGKRVALAWLHRVQ